MRYYGPIEIGPIGSSEEELGELGRELRTRLYPVGLACDGEASILVNESGNVLFLLDEKPELIALSFDDALERLVLGKKFAEH